jgi:adenosylmethionine-8-amino-7-oxononanoate aminotransferase
LAGVTHAPAAEFAEALAAQAPEGLSHVFFSDNGSTAVEAALKQSLQFWQQSGRSEKNRFLSLEHAFHGETMGVMGLSGVSAFTLRGAGGAVRLPSPADDLEDAVASLERELEARADQTAALVIEPMIQGAGGMKIYPAAYLRAARELTQRFDILLIVDEVFTGYGRTGPFWACDHGPVTPDIVCSAKGLSGGILPFAATLSNQRVFEAFLGDPSKAFYYGHTYCGNPLGAAVALEVLEIYHDEEILSRAQAKSQRLRHAFEELGRREYVSQSRSLGMCGALELRADQTGYLSRSGWVVFEEALKRGAYVRPLGNVVYLAPPLNIPDEDLDELLTIVAESLDAAVSGPKGFS